MGETDGQDKVGVRDEGGLPRGAAGALHSVVFLGGAIFMSLEIAGSRVMAPHLGSSIFVWGALIGVIMLALSVGYYLGGKIVDRHPNFGLLMMFVAAAGIFILLIPYISDPVLSAIAKGDTHPRLDPLLGTLILFVVPSVLLAMVSPFAVRLCATKVSGMGGVAGRLYALSTAGSIVGTLATSFILIPAMGTRVLVWSLGGALVILAGGAYAVWQVSRGGSVTGGAGPRKIALVFLLPAALALGTGALSWPSGPGVELTSDRQKEKGIENELIDYIDSPYHLIIVTEHDHEVAPGVKRRRRLLLFNNRIESAIYVDKLDEDGKLKSYDDYESAVDYTSVLHAGMLFHEDPKTVLFIGGGGGVAPTEFTTHYGMKADIAEIDPCVIDVARKHFFLNEGPDVKIHVNDGRRFVKNTDQKWDIIVLDAYTSGGRIPFHLVTKEFFELVKSRLNPGGLVVSNIISPHDGKEAGLYRAIYKTFLDSGFGNVYTFPKFLSKEEFAQLTERQVSRYEKTWAINIILVATQDSKRLQKPEIIRTAARLLSRDEHPVKVRDFRRHVGNMKAMENLSSPEFQAAPILTDDYAPVDLLYNY